MKVKHIKAINFKGFPTLDVEFTGSSVILGGMNGFGKTTIFDALELLITGRIQRMAQYSDKFPNHKYSRSQNHLPLVCDMHAEIVSVIVEFSTDSDNQIILQRCAKVSDMKNPVDFTPFSTLFIYDSDKKEFRSIQDDEYEGMGLTKFAQDYSFLNYLSQEEATSFLKSKDAERSELIQNLFDTEVFDIPLNKIGKILAVQDKMIRKLNETRTVLANDINSLKSIKTQNGSSEYVRLCDSDNDWDSTDPKLSFEGFNSFVSEGGVIDGLLYYLKFENEFKQNNRNKLIERYLADDTIDNFVFFKRWQKSKAHIANYINLRDNLIIPIHQLNSGSVALLRIDKLKILSSIVSDDTIREGQWLIDNYIAAIRTANNLQKVAQEIIYARETLADNVNKHNQELKIRTCPLCGFEYDNFDDLSSAIMQYEESFNSSLSQINKGLSEQFLLLHKFLKENIADPVTKYFERIGISEELVERYMGIKEADILKIGNGLSRLNVSYSTEGSLDSCTIDLKTDLKRLITSLDDSIDFELLNKIYASYIKSIDRNVFNAENLEKKRSYLILKWNERQTELLKQKQGELQIIEKKLEFLQKKKNDLKQLQGQIKQQKTNYINKVISDIQILFYIYSGRILQDNYYGRGLFLKPEIAKNRILFVSGNYVENDVDALYNMSSGQLVAVAVSFLLSLNRLYSKSKFIAIDDPVQTIDDINLWGLMETLRHDFRDWFILLSTHEKNYGQLLDYKFRKVGIISEYIDMGDKH